ncbi:MarR family transcriptional regulator [Marivita sp.]|uniref:MarR family transcriptional regulator n=1 Tax=Marivita sp. TaxID=2003365 RepID=UPI00262C8400|nr:MarR family transcriptional regulator [Marivita sp.]
MKDSSETSAKQSFKLSGLMYVDRSLAVACTRGREAVVSRFRELLHREGFSEQQWRVMRILTDQGEKTSVEISALACIHKVSISRIINSLEGRGLVSRRASETDARSSYVSLTAKGRALMEPLVEEATEIHLQIADEFGTERYEQLLSLLHQLAEINNDPPEGS